MDWLTRPGQLVTEPKVLYFRPEQQVCPIDGKRLKVLKTSTKTVHSTILGTFQARHTELYCPAHKELGAFKSEDLERIVPSDSNFAYDSLVEAGKQRYFHHLQIEEIKELFEHKFNLSISNSGVASLIKKFISCLSFIHHDHMEQIKDYIQAQGGYILHLDATCEGDSPKLTSSIDAVSGFILHSAKLKSENKADIMVFLRVIKEQLGIPHAIISDMGRGIIKSVKAVFPGCPHYICHFHFLGVIGKLLFEEENNILRKKIYHYSVVGKLKALKRECENKYDRSALDQFIQNMNQPMKEVDENHSFEPLVYSLVCWILDYRSIGNGYGFPFDRSYLECYRRLKESMKRIKIFLSYFSYNAKQTKILWHLHSIISEIINDKRLGTTVNHYHIKVEVFERLRSALRAAPRDKQHGLSDLGRSVSVKELKAIETAVEKFNRYLDKKVLASKNKAVGDKLKRVQNHMQKYQHMLLSDPVEVKTKEGKRFIFINRTNNILEQHFRVFSYNHQRTTGNSSMRKELISMHPSTPLVMNLKNKNYTRLMFGDEENMAQEFSKVDILKVRKDIQTKTGKIFFISRKSHTILREDHFLDKINIAFENQCKYVQIT